MAEGLRIRRKDGGECEREGGDHGRILGVFLFRVAECAAVPRAVGVATLEPFFRPRGSWAVETQEHQAVNTSDKWILFFDGK